MTNIASNLCTPVSNTLITGLPLPGFIGSTEIRIYTLSIPYGEPGYTSPEIGSFSIT
jgi:hypothetical protein